MAFLVEITWLRMASWLRRQLHCFIRLIAGLPGRSGFLPGLRGFLPVRLTLSSLHQHCRAAPQRQNQPQGHADEIGRASCREKVKMKRAGLTVKNKATR